MAERTDQPLPQPTPASATLLSPQPSRILAEPATVEACAQDYADAGDVRARLLQQIRGGH
ncbi:hypothetical protein AB0D09_02780 [Streptomyces sp. NPDC049097]|uniref:hypothetical protein n=1 Tax=Streptomyces sp. NPDC049097 TaxID=3155497 RepID=UPI00343CB15F